MYIENIVIGEPLCNLEELLGKDYKNVTVFDDELYLPRLLVKYRFTKSTSKIRRNRKDLCIELNKPDFLEIKIGKKKIWVVKGK